MGLSISTRLGAYEFRTLLGAGGMGEVYRGYDTTLGREVALKILPAAFTNDPDRLARFEREARVLASLNHPNIAAIYGVEHADSVHALVLELVEGESLADRLRRGPVPLPEALRLARQISDALDAAHQKGVVHRDLKPGNIRLTPDGLVKVLDFGLAKVRAGGAGGSDQEADNLSDSPTVTIGGTKEGVILGTAAYMSPEQARGQTVDKRTDIWAFGCVLYEMLSSRPAFGGGTLADTLAMIIERDPDWSALPQGTSSTIRQLLARCLAKGPKRRLRDMGDAVLELDANFANPGQSTSSATQPRRARLWWAAAVAASLVVGLAIGGVWRGDSLPAPGEPAVGFMTRLTFDSGLTTEPSLSADGRFVAYASNRNGEGHLDIYVQQATGGAPLRLTDDTGDDHQPDVSPDGTLVAFRSERVPRGVYVASALGGGTRLIAAEGRAPHFSPDGRSIAFWTGDWLAPRAVGNPRRAFVVPATGGAPSQIGGSLASAGDAIWSPDGKSLLVFGRRAIPGNDTAPDWWWVPLEGGSLVATGAYERFQERGLDVSDPYTQPYPAAWTPDGVLFTATDSIADATSIWRIGIDPASGRVSSDAMRLTKGTTTDQAPAIARGGRMAFASLNVKRLGFVLPLDANSGRATGPLRRIRNDDALVGRTSLSEDGRLQLVPKYQFATGGVWLRDMLTGQERQLAATPRTPLNPVLSNDGKWAAYTVTTDDTGGNGGPGAGFVVEVAGGVPKKVCEPCVIGQWTRDSRQVVIAEPRVAALTRVDRESGARIALIRAAQGSFDRPMFGPGGTWMTFNGNGGIHVAPVHLDRAAPEAEWTTILKTSTAERSAGLSPDGSLLYVLLERDGFRCLYALKLNVATGLPRGEPFLVSHFHDASRQWGSTGFGSAVAEGIFVADLFETTGNIWLTTIAAER